jgi:PTS system mannose-specific IIC component
MSVLQAIIIAIFVYLGSIGSIVGNTLGWYTLGRPLIASLVVGIVMGDVQTALVLGVMLQLAYLGSVTPGAAVAWDLSFSTYIGVAGALTFYNGSLETAIALMWAFAVIGGAIGVGMWNLVYALDLACNRFSQRGAESDNKRLLAFANVGLGNIIGFVCRFIPALVILVTTAVVGAQSGVNIAEKIPSWVTICLTTFGGMMAALGMGILLSFLMKKAVHFCIFLVGFMLVAYLGLNAMAVAAFAIAGAIIYYAVLSGKHEEGRLGNNG